jgi:ElaB/YqjD/DUF883 family membrane-anchored ribosome-binding protein
MPFPALRGRAKFTPPLRGEDARLGRIGHHLKLHPKENVMSEDEKKSLLNKAVHAGERVVELGAEAARLKVRASHAVEDTMLEARRLAKRGRYAAEDLVDDAAYRIKRDPLRSVAITFAVGLGIGALAGWLTGRGGRR